MKEREARRKEFEEKHKGEAAQDKDKKTEKSGKEHKRPSADVATISNPMEDDAILDGAKLVVNLRTHN